MKTLEGEVESKFMRIIKNKDKQFLFEYLVLENDEINEELSVSAILSSGEMRSLQSLVQWSLPHMLGWGVLANPSVIDSITDAVMENWTRVN